MFDARRGSGGHSREIIERLVMVLEIRDRELVFAVEGDLPGPGIPCPAYPLRGQQIADGLRGLRWQGSRVLRIGVGGATTGSRLVAARLIGRLHRVHRVKIGCQIAVLDEFWGPTERRFWRVGRNLQRRSVGLDGGDQVFGWAAV